MRIGDMMEVYSAHYFYRAFLQKRSGSLVVTVIEGLEFTSIGRRSLVYQYQSENVIYGSFGRERWALLYDSFDRECRAFWGECRALFRECREHFFSRRMSCMCLGVLVIEHVMYSPRAFNVYLGCLGCYVYLRV